MILSTCVGESIRKKQEAYVCVSAHTHERSHLKECVRACSGRVRERALHAFSSIYVHV